MTLSLDYTWTPRGITYETGGWFIANAVINDSGRWLLTANLVNATYRAELRTLQACHWQALVWAHDYEALLRKASES